ncbi:MAG: DNA mismatch repair endonuclease MutL [Acidobacteria bacterium]|nr:DNA mismatch repair endonuclease MutL [Acidobacteriota bacterium]
MNKIRVLPEILANKIAAGEIVERPASVVKELVENSIDASGRFVSVTIHSGGKRLITVRDDGTGMNQDDAILSFEHHATSKIETARDLGAIATLGFRGEALPSIASVSRLTMKTRTDDPEIPSGTQIEIQGGILRSVKPVAWDRGTEISVRDLFFNVPARRKFLKTNDTETGHIARLVTHYALCNPEIRFTLQSGDRVLLDAVPVSTVRERIYQVFGSGFLDNMVELEGSDGPVRVHGFSSQPHEQRANAYSQYFFVNRRMVRDKVITGAVRQAYRRCMPASAYPVVVLFLELPLDQVDVNAHPAKTEIRFHNQKAVFNSVRESIERALLRHVRIPEFETGTPGSRSFGAMEKTEAFSGNFAAVREDTHLNFPDSPENSGNFRQDDFHFQIEPGMREVSAPVEDHASLRIRPELLLDSGREEREPLFAESVRVLGQYRESYIIAGDRQGLLIIDQHVAHERILYEKLAGSMKNMEVKQQGLLNPVTIELTPQQAALIEKLMPELQRSGFRVEFFGGASIIVRSVPAIAAGADSRELLIEILENLEAEERGLDLDRIRDRIAVSTACRAAVKANMPLSMEKMRWLVDQLACTQIPTSCPHGRPIVLRFSNREIEKKFGRA